MNTVKVKNIIIGEGAPKICVPIVAKTKVEILESVKKLKNAPVDLVEWRADWFIDLFNIKEVKEAAELLAKELTDIPVLFTIRTSKEGGEVDITAEEYLELNKEALRSGYIDLIDVEIFTGDLVVKEIIKEAQSCGVKVVGSNHDFEKTPPKDDIIKVLRKMQCLDTDIMKIAVMPKTKLDVLELIEATIIAYEKYADRPLVTVSMGQLGVLSRLIGGFSGSAITFGAVENTSAPGQLNAKELDEILKYLKESLI